MKKSWQKKMTFLTVTVLASLLASGSVLALAPEEEALALSYPLTLKVGYSTSEDDPRGVALEELRQRVEEETGGNLLFDIYPSGQLGSDEDLVAGEIAGQVDMTVSSAGNYALYATRMGVSALPFLFTDFESAWAFIDSDRIQAIGQDLEDYNMHVLTWFDNGFRCVTTSESAGPVESVWDMQDLNIRTPDNQIVMETLSELGANPQSYPFAQLKDALREGTFDAQENPIPVIYNNGLYEVQKYLAVTNHSYDAMPLTIRRDLWEALKPEYQAILEKAAKEAGQRNRLLVKDQTESMVSLLEEKGMVISWPDLAPFQAATENVLHVFSNVFGKDLTDYIASLS